MKHETYHGDALQTMQSLEDGCIDAVIMDPPYCSGSVSEASRTASKGQGLRSKNLTRFGWFVGDNMGTAGLVFLLRSVAFESVRLLRNSGSLLCFCDWRMVPNLAPAIESAGLRFQNIIVWDKSSMGLGRGFRAQHELILHFTAGRPTYYNRSVSNVIACKRVSRQKRQHQTEKPVELLKELISVVCPEDGVILDPFAGSGSIVVAAEQLGRSTICIERDEQHLETLLEKNRNAKGRIDAT